MTGHKLSPICRYLGIGRATAYRRASGRPARYARADDRVVAGQIRAAIRTRSSYGYRRVTALVNRGFATGYNPKRIRRVMDVHGWIPRGRVDGAPDGRIRDACSGTGGTSAGAATRCRWRVGTGRLSRWALCSTAMTASAWRWSGNRAILTGADIRDLMQRAVAARFGGERSAMPIE